MAEQHPGPSQEGLEIAQMLRDLGQEFGRNPALADGAGTAPITFAALADQSFLTGRDLERAGVAGDCAVALVCDRSAMSAAVFLALASHAAVAPIPASATPAEATALLADLRPGALVHNSANDSVAEAARSLGIPVLGVRTDRQGGFGMVPRPGSAAPDAPPARRMTGKGLILATSGTTGRPKLVPHTAAQLITGARTVAHSLHLTPGDVSVEVLPLHHVHGLVAGVLAPLCVGAETVIAPSADPDAMLRFLARTGARWYTAAPTIHQSLVRAAHRRPDLAAACRLRVVRSASSALPESVRTGLAEVFGAAVVEAYGMTEAGHQISAQNPDAVDGHGSLGIPPAGTVRIHTADGRPAGPGQAGDILVRSATVTAGYLDNPQANAKGFTDGWLRTGDLGRFDDNGALHLIGRSKEIINRGGAQIAPAEVEDALLSLPGVTEAVVFGVPHPTLGQDVAAAVVTQTVETRAPALRTALFDILSAHKIPSRILIVREIHKGPTGKLRRLEMAGLLENELWQPAAAPASRLEALLAALFGEILETAEIGRDSDFFMSGGDSLSGVRLMVQLNDLFGAAIPPDRLFRHPTPSELAAYLAGVDGGAIARQVDALTEPGAAPGGPGAGAGS